VLDMCAAPGSKTGQLIELLHAGEGTPQPTGLVLANDADNKRCYTLTHNIKRFQSPNVMVLNHDAANFPTIRVAGGKPLVYDRILCDVPCSGDGTFRKNPNAWEKWTPMNAVGLHKLQVRIAFRGAQLLAEGGRLVVSTCSFHPVENEAVVAELLRLCGDSLELIDVSDELPALQRKPGMTDWKMMDREGNWLPDSYEAISADHKKNFKASMWPPTADEVATMNLHRCVRVFPQQQNTGGFFISAFRKTGPIKGARTAAVRAKEAEVKAKATRSTAQGEDEVPFWRARFALQEDDSAATAGGAAAATATADGEASTEGYEHLPSNKPKRGYKEDPYIFMEDDVPYWEPLKKFYQVSDAFPANQLLTRSAGEKKRNIYFVSDYVKQILSNNDSDAVRCINAGVKIFMRSDQKKAPCDYRLSMDGLPCITPHMTGRKAVLTQADIGKVIGSTDGTQLEQLDAVSKATVEAIECGCTVLNFVPEPVATRTAGALACPIEIIAWRTPTHLKPLVSKDDRAMIQQLLGIEAVPEKKKGPQRGGGAAAAKPSGSGSDAMVTAADGGGAEAEEKPYDIGL